jgi:hypothetical protein
MVMTDYIWPLVAALGLVLAYRVVMRWLGNAPRRDIASLVSAVARIQHDVDANKKQFDTICLEWRAKVVELDKKCDRVVVNAKNEIAGDLASVQNITSKGWR